MTNVRSKAVESEVKHQGMKVHDGTFISSLAKVIEDFFAFDYKDIAGVLSECLHIEDTTGELTLESPLGAITGKDTYPMQQRHQFS